MESLRLIVRNGKIHCCLDSKN